MPTTRRAASTRHVLCVLRLLPVGAATPSTSCPQSRVLRKAERSAGRVALNVFSPAFLPPKPQPRVT